MGACTIVGVHLNWVAVGSAAASQIKDFAVLVFNNVVSVVCCCEGELLSRRVVRTKDLHLSTISTAITRNVQC